MAKRIILITGNTETLGYFSRELGIYLHDLGREIFIWDMTKPVESSELFEALPDKYNSLLVTFNFIGLNGEGQFNTGSGSIWEESGVEILSIMVDSPIYYFRQLSLGIRRLSVACIDRNHVNYVRRWHPDIEKVYFFPLCGNEPIDALWMKPGVMNRAPRRLKYPDVPLTERYIDIIFIANYVTKESIRAAISGADSEYRDFLEDICNELIMHPDLPLEETLYRRLRDAFPDEEDASYPEAMYHMVYVDLFIRSHFRARTVQALVDAGFTVHCVGQDWDKLKVLRPEGLIHTDVMMTSADCIRALSSARISLNVMPWFKAGAHDRIFSSMLAGCVALTDGSGYLDEVITPWEDYALFELESVESLTDAVHRLVSDNELAEHIAYNGRCKAEAEFTWARIASEIDRIDRI